MCTQLSERRKETGGKKGDRRERRQEGKETGGKGDRREERRQEGRKERARKK